MKIYDCFMFSDEKMLLEVRLNLLNKFVDKFIIAEASYFHNGEAKNLNFNYKDYPEFKNKIEYLIVKDQPPNLISTGRNDSKKELEEKNIINSIRRDNFQRDTLNNSLKSLNKEDIILINDLDEIPNLEDYNLNKIDNEIIIFKQKMFYYKFNLLYENFIWFGTKATKKKNFISPQWLREIKNKNYPFWRIDTLFSKKKYSNIKFIENGGWHFTCIKKPEDIHNKLLTFAHHQDYESSQISLKQLKKIISEKKVLYDHQSDKKQNNKWFSDKTLKKIEIQKLPSFFSKNIEKYENWLD